MVHWTTDLAQLDSWLVSVSAERLRLRIHAHHRDGVLMTDQVVTPSAQHRIVPVLYAGTPYVAELGYEDADGAWRSLAVSANASTPVDAHRGEWSERRHRFDLLATAPPPTVLPEPAPRLVMDPARPERLADGPDAAPEPTELPNEHEAILLARLVWEPDPLRLSTGNSSELAEFGGRLVSIPQITALPRPASPAGGSAGLARLPAGPGLPPSSADLPPGPGPGGFWFRVNAELIVYGSTEPDATVTLAGRTVALREDGSFSFRFSLPDGDYALPAVATKADGSDQRSAHLRFQRSTQYGGTVGVHPQDPTLTPPVADSIH